MDSSNAAFVCRQADATFRFKNYKVCTIDSAVQKLNSNLYKKVSAMCRILRSHWFFFFCVSLIAILGALGVASARPGLNDDVVIPALSEGWQPGPGSSAPESLSGAKRGVRLMSRPKPDSRRCYWDKDVELDLSGKEIIELELFLFNPINADEISIHFRSGRGWYSASVKVTQAQPHMLQIDIDAFETDGEPNGWDEIDRVRVSIWRSGRESVSLYLYQITATVPRILVVGDGDEATAGALSNNSVAHIEKWMSDIGLSSRRVYSGVLSESMLDGRDIVFLPHNPRLESSAIALLERYVASGGKLFVFYSDNHRLARMMGFEIGSFTRGPTHFPWREIIFDNDAAPGFPRVVYQRANAVITVNPSRNDARAIAHWRGQGANSSTPPAILQSRAGFWMTQIPRKFHDIGKRQMMAAAVSEMAPHLAPRVARRMLVCSGQIGGYSSVPEASLALRELAEDLPNAQALKGELGRADLLYRQSLEAMSRNDYSRVLASAQRIREHLTRAYALSLEPNPEGEMRAVWDHYGVGLYPGDWDRTCRILSEAGINAVFPNMLNSGYAHYDSGILNHSQTFKDFGDQIEQALDAARRYDMEMHVWKVCWMLDGAAVDFIERMEREGRLIMRAGGATIPWLNPAHPDNRKLAIDSIREIARNYDVDGIHLDYVRYSGADVCVSPYSRQAFETAIESRVANWPADVLANGVMQSEYNDWKVRNINKFVAEAYAALKEIDQNIQLSVAVWGGYPDCVRSVAQDWRQWLVDGTADFFMPMNYTDSLDFFVDLMGNQSRFPNAEGRILPGIGVTSSQSSLSASDILQQIEALRARGMPGFILFDLDLELKREVLPILRLRERR